MSQIIMSPTGELRVTVTALERAADAFSSAKFVERLRAAGISVSAPQREGEELVWGRPTGYEVTAAGDVTVWQQTTAEAVYATLIEELVQKIGEIGDRPRRLLFEALRAKFCLSCGAADPRCPCEKDE